MMIYLLIFFNLIIKGRKRIRNFHLSGIIWNMYWDFS